MPPAAAKKDEEGALIVQISEYNGPRAPTARFRCRDLAGSIQSPMLATGRILDRSEERPVRFGISKCHRPARRPPRMTGLVRVPIPSMVIRTRSPAWRVNSSGGTMPVPVSRMTPSGRDCHARASRSTPRSGGPSVRPRSAFEDRCARRARSPGGFDLCVRGHGRGEGDDGPNGAARVVNLGLRQIERVLPLDVACADVVADREADELAARGTRPVPARARGHTRACLGGRGSARRDRPRGSASP